MRKLTLATAGLLALLSATLAPAQVNFPTQTPNVNAVGEVTMCRNTAGTAVPCTGVTPLPVEIMRGIPTAPYPAGAIPITAAGTGTTGAVTGTLAAAPGRITYICGFDISAIGGTAAVSPITVATLSGGVTFTYQLASSAGGVTLNRTFTPCIPAATLNAAISIATTADGTASAVDVNAYGFQL